MSSLKRLKAVGWFFPVALLLGPAWGSVPPRPGTINYVEGTPRSAYKPSARNPWNRRVGGGPIALHRGRQGRGPAYAGHLLQS